MLPYVALHNHSVYTMLESPVRPAELAAAARAAGMDAIALTDRDGLSGALEFHRACVDIGIRPIHGCELTVEGGSHLTLLCRNAVGYRNLCRLLTRDTREVRPVAWRRIRTHADGLIALSGCRRGEVASLLARGEARAAEARARMLAELFPGRFHIEIFHHLPSDRPLALGLIALAARLGLGAVATPNTHYLAPADRVKYLALHSVGTLTLLGQDAPGKKLEGDYHLRTAAEMNALFGHHPEALLDTVRIAHSCDVAPAHCGAGDD